MKLAIVGSRTFKKYNTLCWFITRHIDLPKISLVISGGAQGADTLAERYAKENNIPVKVIRPNWKKHGKAAGFIRNKDIVKECDILVAFWDGKSRGTKHSIDLAEKYKKPYFIWTFY